ncbi:hypothetical protein BTA51_29345 [Hahella sp. CCB-MM4]|uniref:PspA/IM30 family protein n=1 Tax=Hahella sp. (strain CCB-MM4) TaxID=1926491 RepID=UPI000B9BA8C0|nr:PspA/IM30 family protein [Hahella sp. CCB-MM4]OZG69732.1 hypothetical protein BTA51_29345 [Hahella sp. CCB-MM4]
MALFNRFIRLFKADMHAVLDQLEEPDVLLRQAIREMEDEVDQGVRQLKTHQLEQKRTQDRIRTIQESMEEIQGQLDLCFEAGNEVLAKTLLRRKLENDRLLKLLNQQTSRLEEDIQHQTSSLNDHRRRLESMQQKAAVFESVDDFSQKETPLGGTDSRSHLITDEDVELAYLQEQQKRRSV